MLLLPHLCAACCCANQVVGLLVGAIIMAGSHRPGAHPQATWEMGLGALLAWVGHSAMGDRERVALATAQIVQKGRFWGLTVRQSVLAHCCCGVHQWRPISCVHQHTLVDMHFSGMVLTAHLMIN